MPFFHGRGCSNTTNIFWPLCSPLRRHAVTPIPAQNTLRTLSLHCLACGQSAWAHSMECRPGQGQKSPIQTRKRRARLCPPLTLTVNPPQTDSCLPVPALPLPLLMVLLTRTATRWCPLVGAEKEKLRHSLGGMRNQGFMVYKTGLTGLMFNGGRMRFTD